MDPVVTRDDSVTFYSEEFKDHYHCKSGARNESFVKYASLVKNKATIFDLFFGLGYNSAAALDTAKKLTLFCFENDKEILFKILEVKADYLCWGHIQNFVRGFLENNILEYVFGGNRLVMVFGDALETIRSVSVFADFVFFDPFSPSKVPDHWSTEFFRDIKSRLNKGAVLSTYSCARFVRDNMRSAGFVVSDGPVVANHPSTLARA